ncbi:MAG: thioredoxin domain-containing protein [Verrucomicrobiota bacterium]
MTTSSFTRFGFSVLAMLTMSGLVACDRPQSKTGGLAVALDESNIDSFRSQPGRIAIIDYYADWCGPCRRLSPVLEEIAADHHPKIVFGKVNVDHSRQLAAAAQVSSIPDVRIFRDGVEVDRFKGAPEPAEVRARIEKHLGGLQAVPPQSSPGQPTEAIQPAKKDWLPSGMQRR